MTIDVLIVGQGLAGSLLACELMQRRYRVMVVDNGKENASQVAAGLVNPVTGQRFVKSQDVDILLPEAMACYRRLEAMFGDEFFVALPMRRILRHERELNIATKRLSQADYRIYLQSLQPMVDGIEAPFGVLNQTQTGYLSTRLLLSRLREFFLASAAYRQLNFNYHDVVLEPELRWFDVRPKHIVFCEGYSAIANPWFGGLPFQPVKGEILACETANLCPAAILNYGHWLIPLDQHRFKTGATFDPENLDNRPSDSAKTNLLKDVRRYCPSFESVTVYEHKAAIRPATLDKQPFIGSHPRHTNLHVFNGFGAKGSLAIPWYSRQFVDQLEGKSHLNNVGHVRRYYDTHFAA